LQRDGLLKNTVVFILGDHGRHEPVGRSDVERELGHFTAPLLIWMDESLRTAKTFHPRVVSAVASQVDLAPTILALNGLTPHRAPFLGRDLSCVLRADCLQDNLAYMNSVDDDLIALADRNGLSLYLLRAEAFYQTDLKLSGSAVRRKVTDPDVAPRYRCMLALHISSNMLLEQNRIWSWQELGETL
jgi:arylsulfatase A-like enzyme